jgi:DNA-binding CsgD family transcriptional regulator
MKLPFRPSELLFIFLLFIIAMINIVDFWADLSEGNDIYHLVIEAFMVVGAFTGISFLIRVIIIRQKELDKLHTQLESSNRSLASSEARIKALGKEYSAIIQSQLTQWQLTPSEKEVAILMLKGLSFEEIASIRDTKEKTVRQQASNIYKKSDLNGRHEFAAWFFEDFLS